ncbi:MAG: hypothetical protein ACOYXT_01280 [Bacteroidota bacterium]
MNRTILFITALLVAISFLPYGCDRPPSTSQSTLEEAKKAIAESNAIYFQAFATGDSTNIH